MTTVKVRFHRAAVARVHVLCRAAHCNDLHAKLVTENSRVGKKRLVSTEGVDIEGVTDNIPTINNIQVDIGRGVTYEEVRRHAPVARFVTPDEFAGYEAIARAKGFLMVSASPLTRSSHHAGEDFARLKAAREAAQAG